MLLQSVILEVLIKVIIALTAIHCFFLNKKSNINMLLKILLMLSLISGGLDDVLIWKQLPIAMLNAISITIQNGLWLVLLILIFQLHRRWLLMVVIFVGYAFSRIVTNDYQLTYTYDIYYISAFCYVMLFLIQSFKDLKKNDLKLFQSNKYLLAAAPLLLFFGWSFLFNYKSDYLNQQLVFKDSSCYYFVISIANLYCYTLINVYILKEYEFNKKSNLI